MTDKEQAKAVEDLRVVRAIMESCAKRQEDNGVFLVIWGLLVPIAAAVNYILVNMELWKFSGPLWGIVMLAGGCISFVVGRKRNEGRMSTKGDMMQIAVWIACWISILITLATGLVSGRMRLDSMMLFIACILACAYFVSGFMSGTAVMKIAAAGWWLAGIIAFFTPVYGSPMVIAVATVFFTFIPGLILNRRYRRK